VNRVELPTRSGAYRWYYADVTAGEVSAVFIFMIGSIFSARYAASLKKGGLPRQHSAVNFALYEKGARSLWVLTEYQDVSLEDDGRTLRIGASSLHYEDGSMTMVVKERTTPWGSPTEATVRFVPQAPIGNETRLVDGLAHWWRPICARGEARVTVPTQGIDVTGRGYHDGNHGDVALGTDLSGWEWTRTHHAHGTTIQYQPWGGSSAIDVTVDQHDLTVRRASRGKGKTTRTGWGLQVPATLGVGGTPKLLESSPFYARLEAHSQKSQALGEVADFARFHRPTIRWMANFRTRYAKEEGAR
jgi:carotenoid 1,2-hydratase